MPEERLGDDAKRSRGEGSRARSEKDEGPRDAPTSGDEILLPRDAILHSWRHGRETVNGNGRMAGDQTPRLIILRCSPSRSFLGSRYPATSFAQDIALVFFLSCEFMDTRREGI